MQTRRQFLATTIGTSAVISLGEMPPAFLLQASEASRENSGPRVLVVVQLSGGNDGLNTVVPYTNPLYRSSRPTLAVGRDDVLKINNETGFHPAARGLADLLEAQQLCVVQGIGYPNPNRSHFESMDIWHSCQRKTEARHDGWLGRCIDAIGATSGQDVPAMHLGRNKQPFALASRETRVPSIQSIDNFRLDDGGANRLSDTIGRLTRSDRSEGNDLLGFVQSSTTAALAVSKRFETAMSGYTSDIDYPRSRLAEKLKAIAQLIDAGLQTRIYYVTLDGFDTHSQQAAAHAALLREFGDAISAFVRDVDQHGHGDRVAVMSFSEFGRRVKENASEGTDHGAAAPMFFAGKRVKPGLLGPEPDLENLQNGDVRFHTDFREAYAAVLMKWLQCDAESVLGKQFTPIDVFG